MIHAIVALSSAHNAIYFVKNAMDHLHLSALIAHTNIKRTYLTRVNAKLFVQTTITPIIPAENVSYALSNAKLV